jgi:hypothetical protein
LPEQPSAVDGAALPLVVHLDTDVEVDETHQHATGSG